MTGPTTKIVAPLVLGLALLSCSDDDDDAAEDTAAPATSADAATTAASTTPAPTTSGSPATTEGASTTTGPATSTSGGGTPTTAGDGSTTSLDVEERLDDAADALERGDFTTMLRLLELSGLADEIDDRAVTFLAPTDDAFTELGSDEIADLLSDPSRIDDILRRHVLDGALSYDDLRAATTVTTIDGEELSVTVEGDTVMVEGAEVTEPAATDEQSGEQGIVVFGIDRVLVEI